MTKLFISYARKDRKYAEKLVGRFAQEEADVWIDWEDIPPSTDWWDEIKKGIEGADVFLFLISPDSIVSKVCKEEINHAVANGKRLVPVVVRDVNPQDAPFEVSKLNWIFFREVDVFDEAFRKLDLAIHANFEWVRIQREIQVKALKWERQAFEKSYLLRGKELKDIEKWFQLEEATDPAPTELLVGYVRKSRELLDRQRKSVTVGLISLAILGIAYYVWQDRSWFRIWHIPQACPNVNTAVVEIAPVDLVQEPATLLDDFSDIESETDLWQCRSDMDAGTGVVQVDSYFSPSEDEYDFAFTLPPLPAYQMDFLPEIRHFEPDEYSLEDAITFLEAATAYSVGNYDDAINDLEGTTNLAGKILLAQSYLLANDFEISRTAYQEAIDLAKLNNVKPNQLQMGLALAMWYPRVSDKIESDPDLYDQNVKNCDESFYAYAEALKGKNVNNDWVLISELNKFYCWHPDKGSLQPRDAVTGNPYQDLLSALILMETGDVEENSELIANLLESSNDQISLANLELSKFQADREDCTKYRFYLNAFKKSAFSKIDRSTVQYYYYTEKDCWPFDLVDTQ